MAWLLAMLFCACPLMTACTAGDVNPGSTTGSSQGTASTAAATAQPATETSVTTVSTAGTQDASAAGGDAASEETSSTTVTPEETAALAGSSPAIPDFPDVSAPGTLRKAVSDAYVDYSNTADGYIMAEYTSDTDLKLRLIIQCPDGEKYTYVVTPHVLDAYPLSGGNGSYTVTVYRQAGGDTKYASVLSVSFTVAMEDEFAPFLRPNQYVNYSDAPNTIAKGAELAAGKTDTLEIVGAVYSYIVNNISYDTLLATTVTTGYLPDLDAVLEKRRGICFDYAALMAAMLRSQGIPCKLVVGYVGQAYHAWINVYVEGTGWIDGVIYFDGESWQRMDPTFASSAGGSKYIEKYIGKGTEYSPRYFY